MKMSEINEIAKTIADAVDPAAKIIFGAYHDKNMKSGQLKVTIVATGFSGTGNFQKPASAALSSLFNVPMEKKPEHGAVFAKEEKEVDRLEKEENRPIRAKHEAPKKSSDIWDIHTFLRKKKK